MASGYVQAQPLRLPLSGNSMLSAHCSSLGALDAAPKANGQALALLAAYRAHGPLTDQEAADRLGLQRCAVNARRAALIGLGLVDAQPKGTRTNARTGIRNATWGLV